MKSKLYIFGLLLAFFTSCEKQKDVPKVTAPISKKTETSNFEKFEKERLAKRKNIDKRYRKDSIQLDKILTEALNISTENISKNTFFKEYEAKFEDENIVKVTINTNFHFTKSQPHLIIRRQAPNEVLIDIYKKDNTAFKRVASHVQWSMTYVNDTIRDINGDGLNDFVVNWYGASGCCLKAFSNVYLLRADKKEFSKNFEFINPTFSPKEKIIRGICYGHPGNTEMYKYKWNGEQVDTLEFVSYEVKANEEKTGKIIISNKPPYSTNYKIFKRLNHSPKEYEKIEGYNWFLGNF